MIKAFNLIAVCLSLLAMKQYLILLLVLLSVSLNSNSQNRGREIGPPDGAGRQGVGQEENKMDSLGYDDVESVIKSWKLVDYSTRKSFVKLDTLLGQQHTYNPIFRTSISNSYLGNLGSPYKSNIYMDRIGNEDFHFFNNYRAYMQKPEDIVFFNTTTPYTSLYYETGGPKGRSENLLRVLQTQNITPDWNFGISYNLISSDGQYQNQKTKLYDFTLFSSYVKERYSLNFVVNQNSISNEENGGVDDITKILDGDDTAENIQVKLNNDAKSKLSNFNLFMKHSYGIGEEKELITDEDTTYTYPVNLVYNFNYELDSRRFKETLGSTEFYGTNFYDDTKTFDKVEYSNLRNTFQIVFNENDNKWIRLGARFGIVSEFGKYNARDKENEYIFRQKDTKIHNNEILASFYSMSGPSLNWKATGNYVFEGYRQNDFNLNYELTKWIGVKDTILNGISVKGNLSSKRPNFILENYYGNHQQWNLNLDKSTVLELEIEYFNEKRGLKIGGQFNQIDKYTYFGLNATPEQANSGITVLTGYLEKTFKLGNFYLRQKLVGQNTSNKNILPLPTFSIYSNNYYKNTFFDGALGLQIGFGVYYNTAFYTPDYMPSIGQFYLQKDKELGDYPKLDVYVNLRIKRTRIFFMYEHLNASMGSRNYFTSPNYPLNPAMFKYGLIWTFYN